MNLFRNYLKASLSFLPIFMWLMKISKGSSYSGVTPQPQHLASCLSHRLHWIYRPKCLKRERKVWVQSRVNNIDRSMEKSHKTTNQLKSYRGHMENYEILLPTSDPRRKMVAEEEPPSSKTQEAVKQNIQGEHLALPFLTYRVFLGQRISFWSASLCDHNEEADITCLLKFQTPYEEEAGPVHHSVPGALLTQNIALSLNMKKRTFYTYVSVTFTHFLTLFTVSLQINMVCSRLRQRQSAGSSHWQAWEGRQSFPMTEQ